MGTAPLSNTLAVPAGRDVPAWRLSPRNTAICVVLLAIAVVAVRLSGPPDLMDNEQQLQSSYVMDIVQNGHWAIQKDQTGDIASKPPLYAWLAAPAVMACGRINRVAMCLPSILSSIAMALIVWHLARRYFDELAGFLAAACYILSLPFVRQVGLARMDGLMPFVISLGAVAALRAWMTGRGWVWFWLAGAAGTLTKGPVGLPVSAAGLIAGFWNRGTGPRRRTWPWHLIGIALFVLIGLGWYWASCAELGSQPVYDKLIKEELLSQSVQTRKGQIPGLRMYVPPLHFLSRFLPWSLIACVGLWRVWRLPSENTDTRKFERFVFFWFVAGLIPFAIASHQRADLILPLYPPAAILVGCELARWMRNLRPRAIANTIGIAVVIGLALMIVQYRVLAPRNPAVKMTLAVREMARTIERAAGKDLPITHVMHADYPYAIQYYLNTMRPLVESDRAARLLKGDAAAYVAVCDRGELNKHLGDTKVYELAQAQLSNVKLRLLSNRPTMGPFDAMAMSVGALDLRTQGVRWDHAAEHDFSFAGNGWVEVANSGKTPARISIRSSDTGKVLRFELLPSQSRRVALPVTGG